MRIKIWTITPGSIDSNEGTFVYSSNEEVYAELTNAAVDEGYKPPDIGQGMFEYYQSYRDWCKSGENNSDPDGFNHPFVFEEHEIEIPGEFLKLEYDDEDPKYLNKYQCSSCDYKWTDIWDCGCDDDCTECGERRLSPYYSERIQ